MLISIQFPDIPDAERALLVEQLVVLVEALVDALAEENHRLAGFSRRRIGCWK